MKINKLYAFRYNIVFNTTVLFDVYSNKFDPFSPVRTANKKKPSERVALLF